MSASLEDGAAALLAQMQPLLEGAERAPAGSELH
jgi:hypothetical protein